ncbi:hypothetical protein EIN_080630 [Entamoeba invadens IP1]|uniref:hypothetical protein n=1 Tax=Entamoeba invadens IP1 TaxID=370355 RepID=UPI0002C3FB71|nr:hypothetical protein EIN_080630 [Entamoeba invadens IP1]ELP85091.1 hypothetical protein EIN_080630 [Entamoeba invadens IP1]|eukprot:XP_004184437.1 hypothetical protein EIN_080630 [Entamoeba invadens IP1]
MVWTLYHPSFTKPINLFNGEKCCIGRSPKEADGVYTITMTHHSISGTHLMLVVREYKEEDRINPIQITDLSTFGTYLGESKDRMHKGQHYTVMKTTTQLYLASEPKELKLEYKNYDFFCVGIRPPTNLVSKIEKFGHFVNTVDECSHVVCKKLLEAEDIAAALVYGKKFITPNWFSHLDDMRTDFPKEENFIPETEHKERGIVALTPRNHLFDGWSFLTKIQIVKKLAEGCGGTIGSSGKEVCLVTGDGDVNTESIDVGHYAVSDDVFTKAILYSDVGNLRANFTNIKMEEFVKKEETQMTEANEISEEDQEGNIIEKENKNEEKRMQEENGLDENKLSYTEQNRRNEDLKCNKEKELSEVITSAEIEHVQKNKLNRNMEETSLDTFGASESHIIQKSSFETLLKKIQTQDTQKKKDQESKPRPVRTQSTQAMKVINKIVKAESPKQDSEEAQVVYNNTPLVNTMKFTQTVNLCSCVEFVKQRLEMFLPNELEFEFLSTK